MKLRVSALMKDTVIDADPLVLRAMCAVLNDQDEVVGDCTFQCVAATTPLEEGAVYALEMTRQS